MASPGRWRKCASADREDGCSKRSRPFEGGCRYGL